MKWLICFEPVQIYLLTHITLEIMTENFFLFLYIIYYLVILLILFIYWQI